MESMEEVLKKAKEAEIPKVDPPPPPPPDPVVITDDLFEKEFEKRLGGKPGDFIKKEEQVIVLSEEQKKEAEEKKNNDVLKFGLEHNLISAKDQEDYISLIKEDNVELARKKFIDQNPELGAEAANVFNTTFRLDEDDEIEDGENKVPNKEKIAAKKLIEGIANEVREVSGKKIKGLPKLYEAHLQNEAIKKINAAVITTGLSSIPKKLLLEEESSEFEGVVIPALKVSLDLTDEDMTAVQNFISGGALTKKGLTADEVKEQGAMYLLTSKSRRLVSEALKVGYLQGIEDQKRGSKGIPVRAGEGGSATGEETEGHKLVEGIKNSS